MAVITVLRNDASRSARAIAAGLRALRLGINVGLARVGDTRRCGCHRYVINWGVGASPANFRQRQLTFSNSVEGVNNCRDKRKTLSALRNAEVPCIDFAYNYSVERANDATDQQGPAAWLREDKKIVVRHTTTGHSGAGIEIVRLPEGGRATIPHAPLYTRYFRKDAEYRVHVMSGAAIHIQQKRRRNGWEGEQEDHLVRTHANGYVFATQNLDCDTKNYRAELVTLALRAATAVGANHAAVDILVRHKRTGVNMVVCEMNSAPACDAESTKNAYVQGFARAIQAAGIR